MSDEKELTKVSARQYRRPRWIKFAVWAMAATAVIIGIIDASPDMVVYLLVLVGLLVLVVNVAEREPTGKSLKAGLSRYLLLLGSLTLTLLTAEVGLAIVWTDVYGTSSDERAILYRYDETLGWFPRENSSDSFRASRTIRVTHNSQGFRDTEKKDGQRPAIIFSGDSFVWGYDVEAPERFTDKLQAKHPELRIYNFGVSGYGTDQSFLLLQKYLDRVAPKLVFLVFCSGNDEEDNSQNMLQRTYPKPYFVWDGSRLKLEGVPVPPSERSFRVHHPLLCRSRIVRLLSQAYFNLRFPKYEVHQNPTREILLAMNRFLQERGIEFAVGFTEPKPNIEALLKEVNVPCLDLATTNRYGPAGHWTPEGHDFVCAKIEKFLLGASKMHDLVHDPRVAENVRPHAVP